MNKQLFVMAFCMVGGSFQAMGPRLITQEKVSLVIGEEQDTIEMEIPLCYVRSSKTLRGYLDNCHDEKPIVPVPLPRKAGVFVAEHLVMVYRYFMSEEKRETLDTLREAVNRLDSTILVLVVRALEYLDIPLFLKIAYEEVLKRSPATLGSSSVALLPHSIRRAVMRNQVAHFLGLKYADLSVAASGDYEERRPFVDHAVCRGHEGGVTSVCVTGDNKIVSGSSDKTVRVWDMQGNELAVCRGHEGEVISVCVTGDNNIVSSSKDCTVRVFDMQGNELAVCRGHKRSVTSVCVTPDNKIVSGSHDETLRVWDMQGNELAVCKGHKDRVNSVCVTGDNKIVSGSYDKTVRVFDMQGNELAVCRGHECSVDSVCLTSDNKIVSVSGDALVRAWDIDSNQLAVCKGHEGPIRSVCVTADSKIVSSSSDRTVRVWDMEGKELAVCRGHRGLVYSVCVTVDNRIVSGSDDKMVCVFDMQGNELAVCRGHEGEVNSVCVTSDNKIVSGSSDRTVRIWYSEKFFVLEKSLSDVGSSVEKCKAIWELIQKYNPGTEDTQNFCSDIKALLA